VRWIQSHFDVTSRQRASVLSLEPIERFNCLSSQATGVLLVIAYSRGARGSLRNVTRTHEGCVVRSFGRAALFAATEFGAFQALRLREKHGTEIQVEWTEPFNEFETVRADVRDAARAYESREEPATPYTKFAAGRDLLDPETMRGREL